MDNENNTNRDDSVPASPNLGAIGGLGGENGAPLVEGLALGGQGGGNGATPVSGLGTFGAATDETLQASAGGIVISPMRVLTPRLRGDERRSMTTTPAAQATAQTVRCSAMAVERRCTRSVTIW